MNYRETTKIVIDECYLALSKVEEKQIDMLIDYLFKSKTRVRGFCKKTCTFRHKNAYCRRY